MTAPPDYLRNRTWQATLALLLAATLFAFHAPITEMVREWATKADYSHGFFVAPFALYLLWTRRALMPRTVEWPDSRGLVLIVIGVAIAFVAGRTNYAKELIQGLGLILALAGVIVFQFGRYALRWAWPGLVFLIFMVKMPDKFEFAFAFKLQQIASQSSNLLLQTMGYPSYVGGDRGTVITIHEMKLGVEKACSGLSMVLTFAAVATAFALMVKRPVLDRVIILASALPIAIVVNILRITATALVYVAGWEKLGKFLFHDLAGWLMMPAAILFLWGVMKVLDWLFTTPAPPERDNMIRLATQTATADWQMPAGGPPETDRRRPR